MILILKNQIILQENGQYLATLAPRSHLCFKEMRTCTTRQFSQCQTRSDVRRLVSFRKLLSPPKRTNRVLCPGLVIRRDKLRHIYQNEWRERSLSMEDSEMLVHPCKCDALEGVISFESELGYKFADFGAGSFFLPSFHCINNSRRQCDVVHVQLWSEDFPRALFNISIYRL